LARPAHEFRKKALELFPDAVVAERGPNFLRHMVPSQPGKRILDVSIGNIHYDDGGEWKEIDTNWQTGTAPWDFKMERAAYNAFALEDFSTGQVVKYVHPASGEEIAFEPQQLQYTNDIDQIQPIEDPQAVLAINELDKLQWYGAYGPGLDMSWQCQTGRFDKRLKISSASDLPAVQQFITDGGNPVLRLQFIFQHSSGVSLWVDGVEWSGRANDPVETSGYVEFKDSEGAVLWTFNPPRSFDEAGDFLGTFRFRKTGPNLSVEHRIPISYLASAIYPVEIDVTIDDEVEASADDGYTAGGGLVNSSTSIRVGNIVTASSDGFYRFVNVSGLSGAPTIDVAYISIYSTTSGMNVPTDIAADDQSGPSAPTSASDHAGRSRTTASVAWDATLTDGQYNNSPSIVSVIQELVDSFTPTAIQILHDDGGAMNDASMWFRSYDHVSATPPLLHIEYSSSGPTIEQEGFRWRDDDGSESAATWNQSQDVNDSVAKSTNIRVRVLLNATNDPATTQWKLQYKETSAADSAYRDVPLS
jgi:hypothetical protein